MFDLKSFGLDPRSRRARANRLGVAIVASWRGLARDQLKSTLRDYIHGIVIRETGDDYVIVSLRGELNNKLENGIEPHDMRSYLLHTQRPYSSPIRYVKAGPRKGQPYRYIMFRKKVAEIQKMGFRGAYPEAKKLEAYRRASSGKTIAGSRFPSGRSAHYMSKGGVESVSDALSGMVRLVGATTAQGARAGANTTYATWRTVSYKRPEAWQHPGFQALHLAREISQNMGQITEEAGL
jgi:hypothetical protein